MVFNRVFNRDDFYFRRMDLAQEGIERCRFAAPRGPRGEQHAVGSPNFCFKACEELRVDAELGIGDHGRLRVQEAKHDRLAVVAGDEGGAHFNLVLILRNAEAAVLRPVSDVELHSREKFDTRIKLTIGLRVKNR